MLADLLLAGFWSRTLAQSSAEGRCQRTCHASRRAAAAGAGAPSGEPSALQTTILDRVLNELMVASKPEVHALLCCTALRCAGSSQRLRPLQAVGSSASTAVQHARVQSLLGVPALLVLR